jgi:ELWxxDGT repeat protein
VADIHRGVPELNIPNASSSPRHLTAVGKSLFFSADEPFAGRELWKTDGVSTTRVADLFSGTQSSDPTQLTALGGRFFFNAFRTGQINKSLWVSDGTSKGTRELRFKDGQFSGIVPEARELVVFANQLYFTPGQPSLLAELWSTDGTEAGTRIVKRLTPTFVGSFPQELTVVGRTLFFTARDKTHGRELWKTDGTAAGTVRLDIGGLAVPSYPQNLTAVGGKLFFTANDRVNGRELWMTDGTSGGTRMVRDITPAILPGQIRSTYLDQLVGVGSTLYFVADNGKSGREIWKSDGTAKGTVLVTDTEKDVFGASSEPTALTPVGNTLFFQVTESGRYSVLKLDTMTGDISRVAEGTRFDNRQLVGSNLFFSDNFNLWNIDVSAELRTASNSAVQLSIAATASVKLEGTGTAPTPFTFRVNRTGSSVGQSTVAWAVTGTGSNPANAVDFSGGVLPGGTLTFAAGETSKTITVEVAAESAVEANEGFKVTISAPTGATLGTATATGTILNDDTALAITPLSAAKAEGRTGPKPFTFTVTRTGRIAGSSTALWAVAGTGANPTDPDDFSGPTSGTVSFSPGQSSRTITINVRGDLLQERDETFRVSLSAPTGAVLTTSAATGTILNDDLIGDARANTLVGTARAEFIDGGANRDTLTGRGAADVFGFRFGESRLIAPDVITDFAFGVDKIDLFSPSGAALAAPTRFSRAVNNASAPTLGALAAAVFADANGALPGNQALGANGAVLVRSTNAAIAGTYLVVNNGVAGRSLTDDVMVKLNGSSGALPALGVSPVSSVFF